MVKNAIILAGGLGTRLQSVVKDIPKPMAPINGTPFLQVLLDYLDHYGIEQVILAVGFRGEVILEYFENKYKNINIFYSAETKPLGTGGASKKAAQFFGDEPYFLLNGDSIFTVDLHKMSDIYEQEMPDMCMALKHKFKFDRYGVVEYDEWHQVKAFKEKQYCDEGWINGGVYLLSNAIYNKLQFPARFSFEKDLMEDSLPQLEVRACPMEGYFIDIGIPEDYARAQVELKVDSRG